MQTPYKPAAIDNAKDYAADCARRAAELRAKAAVAPDWVERDRLLLVAQSYAQDAYFWGRDY